MNSLAKIFCNCCSIGIWMNDDIQLANFILHLEHCWFMLVGLTWAKQLLQKWCVFQVYDWYWLNNFLKRCADLGQLFGDGNKRFNNLSKSARVSLVKLCFILYSITRTLLEDVPTEQLSSKGQSAVGTCVSSDTDSTCIGSSYSFSHSLHCFYLTHRRCRQNFHHYYYKYRISWVIMTDPSAHHSSRDSPIRSESGYEQSSTWLVAISSAGA